MTEHGRYVLDQILSGEATEIVVERIHGYLGTISEDIRGGKVPMDQFIIYKVPKACLSSLSRDSFFFK